ncbi:hypothetical protein evm_015302 [Chilo suppressalis]|nr:hypothetical protein evm_015302 [Chilo suppressalis]
MPAVDKVLHAENTDETLPNFKRTSFFKLMKSLQLKYPKESEGRTIYYTEETWINEGHTMNKIWQDHTIKTAKEAHREGLSIGLKNPSGKGKHLIVLYIWAQVKGYIAESWKRCIDHVIKEEQKMLKLNGIVDDVVDKFIIKVGASSE